MVIGVIVGVGVAYAILKKRTRDLRGQNQKLEEQAATLRKREAEAQGAAARSGELERKVKALRERATVLETQAAGDAAALESERKAHTVRVDDMTTRQKALIEETSTLRAELSEVRDRAHKAESALESERKSHKARLEEIRGLGKEVRTKFGALSSEALERSGKAFLRLVSERFQMHKEAAERDLDARQKEIQNLVRPLGESLREFRRSVDKIEKGRAESQGKLEEQVRSLATGQSKLSAETRHLVQALRKPQTRGRWGEVQLRRVLEMAGMVRNQDFEEQPAVQGALRPDLILRLPGGRAIVVDAKTPLEGYLNAVEATTEVERQQADKAHARHVRNHVQSLAGKKYWDRIPESVDFVVMFLPGEAIFARAIETDPELLDHAVNNRILISTPTTFIALAKAIAYGWRQEKVAEESRKIAQLGRMLFERLTTFAGHLQKTGKSLRQAVEHYNRSVGSFESRLLPAANRFDELHVVPAGSRIEASGPVATAVRGLASSEPAAALPDAEEAPTPALPAVTASEALSSGSNEPAESQAPAPSAPVPAPRTAGRAISRQEVLDSMLRLLRKIEPDLELNPKKSYVGLLVEGRPRNFFRFSRRRDGVVAVFSLPDGESLREAFETEGLQMRTNRQGQILVPLTGETVADHADFLLDLARRARDAHRGPGRRPHRRRGAPERR